MKVINFIFLSQEKDLMKMHEENKTAFFINIKLKTLKKFLKLILFASYP